MDMSNGSTIIRQYRIERLDHRRQYGVSPFGDRATEWKGAVGRDRPALPLAPRHE